MSPVTSSFTPGTALGVPSPSPVSLPVPKVGPGQVVLVSDRPGITLRLRLGNEPSKEEGGVGGWTEVARDGDTNALEWDSTPLERLPIHFLMDGLVDNVSVEGQIEALKRMGRPPEGAPRGTMPPSLRVGGMVPHGGKRWALESIDWGVATWQDMRRVRIEDATVVLVEYELARTDRVTKPTTSASTRARTYRVKAKDTLASIAKDRLGAATAGDIAAAVRVLRSLNGLRSSRSLKAGMTIKLPTVTTVASVSPGTALT